MIIQLALYKGNDTIIDRIIKFVTRSKYSHSELIIDNYWISSSGTKGGVTISPLRPLNHTDYDYFDIKVDGRKLKKVMKWIESKKDSKYDFLALITGTLLSSGVDDINKYFCSEMCVDILKQFNETKSLKLIAHHTDPGDLGDVYGNGR